MTKNRVFTTGVCEMFWDERGFVRLNLLETQKAYGLEEAKKQFDIASQITSDQKYKVLVDTRGSNALPDKDAQDFTSNSSSKIAEAIIVESLSMRILAKFYMKKNKNNVVKIFSKEKAAIEWLVNFSND